MTNTHTIVVPVYNKSWLTLRCLGSVLQNSSDLTRELIVIDDASSDDTPAVLEQFKVQFEKNNWEFTILRNEKNLGFGSTVNRGLQRVKTPFVSILNNDTWLMPAWDKILLKRIDDLKLSMISPYAYEKQFDEKNMNLISARYVQRNLGRWRRQWSSILMLFRTQTIKDLGYFDERFFLTYEDTDLRERMNRAKLSYGQIGDCFIWHHSRGTRGESDNKNPVTFQYEIEAKQKFIDKWGYDPSVQEAHFSERMKRRWNRWKERLGYF